jgi:hypothetical protein
MPKEKEGEKVAEARSGSEEAIRAVESIGKSTVENKSACFDAVDSTKVKTEVSHVQTYRMLQGGERDWTHHRVMLGRRCECCPTK